MNRKNRFGRWLALAILIGSLSACSDLGSNADIEVMQQQQDQQVAELRRLEDATRRSSMRDALEDPRLHPYALARTMFEQSDFQRQTPMFLLQFAAALIDSESAPDIVDREVDQLLASFAEISRLQPYFAENQWEFYIRLLQFSQFTLNTERTEQLRSEIENLFELYTVNDHSRARMAEFYLEQGELADVERHLRRIDEPYRQVQISLKLAEKYLQRGNDYEAGRLIDEISLLESELLNFIDDWVSILLLANREAQAVNFVLDGFEQGYLALNEEDSFNFYRNIVSFNDLVKQALRLEREEDARNALLRAYRQLASFSGLELFNIRLSVPFLQAFATLGDQSAFADVKRDLVARTYTYVQNPDYFVELVRAFSEEMHDHGLAEHALEFIELAARMNDDEQRIPEPEFHYVLGYAFGLLGDEARGHYHLQILFDDPDKLAQLSESLWVSPVSVIQDLISAGYTDEAIALVGAHPRMNQVRIVFAALVEEERFVEALQKLGEYNLDDSATVWVMLTIAHGYLKRGVLPNAEAREVMQQYWSRYMPADESV